MADKETKSVSEITSEIRKINYSQSKSKVLFNQLMERVQQGVTPSEYREIQNTVTNAKKYYASKKTLADDYSSAFGDFGGLAKDDNMNTYINNMKVFEKVLKDNPAIVPIDPNEDPKQSAFNAYYSDLYSLGEGTSGRQMYDRLTESYQNQAMAGMNLADLNYQSQAMEQARTVKSITDQIKSERMARLKAGMSESQIANQDMQMLMSNVNALNENARMLNQQRSQGQMNYDLAKDQAYDAYLEQANMRGQNAVAMAAADAGDAGKQTSKILAQMYPNGGYSTEDYENLYGFIINSTNNKNQS